MRARLPRDPTTVLLLLFGAFVLTRVLLLVLTRSPEFYPQENDPLEINAFAAWGAAFAGDGGPLPLRDGPWEYPVGAAAVMLAPALVTGAPYALGFVGQLLLWDAALLLLLGWLGLRRGSLAGAWVWVAVVPLLGPVALGRFDLVPTAFAVAGLAAACAAPMVAGVLLGAGAVIKLWPALLLALVFGLCRGRGRALVGSVAVGAATLLAVGAYGGLSQVLSFLTYQQERGLQVESVPALPLMLARAWGDARMVGNFGFGSSQIDGPWAPTMLLVATLGTVAVLAGTALLAWRVRRTDLRLALPALAVALLAGVLLTDKVLSAQYPLWLAGLVCLSLCSARSPLRPAVLPLLALLVLTQLVYPLDYVGLVDEASRRPVLLLAARDLLIAVVGAVAVRGLWRLPVAPVSDGAR